MPSHPNLRSIDRVGTDLAIIAFAVPTGLNHLAPPMRGECATTLDNLAAMAGLGFLMARLAWTSLKALNDASERWLAGPEHGCPPKSKPLDDF